MGPYRPASVAVRERQRVAFRVIRVEEAFRRGPPHHLRQLPAEVHEIHVAP
jgi:hypothetical protein